MISADREPVSRLRDKQSRFNLKDFSGESTMVQREISEFRIRAGTIVASLTVVCQQTAHGG
jgi:hypothetical protein